MLQYLVILLDDTSISYCHYDNQIKEKKLMPLDILREGILFGMKENLMIQFVYPEYDIPKEYSDLIETIDHSKIKPSTFTKEADVIVFDNVFSFKSHELEYSSSVVLRLSKNQLFDYSKLIGSLIGKVRRLNIVITDVESFNNADFQRYTEILDSWNDLIVNLYIKGERPQINLLTDRIMLDNMNNCGAGDTSISLAPDGHFYVCPAFYHIDKEKEYGLGKCKFTIGSLYEGVKIANSNLFKLDFSPICSECDAFHCKRCVWLNRKLTYEVNTPSKQQCVISHIERKSSIALLKEISKKTGLFSSKHIKELDYYDPFEKLLKSRQ